MHFRSIRTSQKILCDKKRSIGEKTTTKKTKRRQSIVVAITVMPAITHGRSKLEERIVREVGGGEASTSRLQPTNTTTKNDKTKNRQQKRKRNCISIKEARRGRRRSKHLCRIHWVDFDSDNYCTVLHRTALHFTELDRVSETQKKTKIVFAIRIYSYHIKHRSLIIDHQQHRHQNQ